MLQERGYIQNLVSKITWWQPDLIVVEKSVARLAQELLLAKGTPPWPTGISYFITTFRFYEVASLHMCVYPYKYLS